MKKVETKYAGFWVRFLASSLDQLIIGIPVFIMLGEISPLFIDYSAIRASANKDLTLVQSFIGNLIYLEIIASFLWAAIFAYCFTTRWQASPGKRIMGIYVIKANGGKVPFLDGFLRCASLPLFMLLVQIFARDDIYKRLGELAEHPEKYKTLEQMLAFVSGSEVVAQSSMVAFLLGATWVGMIAFTRQKTAFHDILFETRVVYGKL